MRFLVRIGFLALFVTTAWLLVQRFVPWTNDVPTIVEEPTEKHREERPADLAPETPVAAETLLSAASPGETVVPPESEPSPADRILPSEPPSEGIEIEPLALPVTPAEPAARAGAKEPIHIPTQLRVVRKVSPAMSGCYKGRIRGRESPIRDLRILVAIADGDLPNLSSSSSLEWRDHSGRWHKVQRWRLLRSDAASNTYFVRIPELPHHWLRLVLRTSDTEDKFYEADVIRQSASRSPEDAEPSLGHGTLLSMNPRLCSD